MWKNKGSRPFAFAAERVPEPEQITTRASVVVGARAHGVTSWREQQMLVTTTGQSYRGVWALLVVCIATPWLRPRYRPSTCRR